jgi:hypothetical protein
MTDEHFIVWMRGAALPNFRKLWGKISEGMEPGNYILSIENEFVVSTFGGTKSFFLSTNNSLGGKNTFLAIAYIVAGVLCFMIAIGFCCAETKDRRDISEAKLGKLKPIIGGLPHLLALDKKELISMDEDRLIHLCWKKVKAIDTSLEAQGVRMFKNFFELEPAALELFQFRSSSNLYENKHLKAHGVAVMTQVEKCVKDLR